MRVKEWLSLNKIVFIERLRGFFGAIICCGRASLTLAGVRFTQKNVSILDRDQGGPGVNISIIEYSGILMVRTMKSRP